MTKICRLCKQTKQVSMFYRRSSGYLKSECKQCDLERKKTDRKNNPEKYRERTKAEYQRNKQSKRNAALKSRFGITCEVYNKMLSDQKGVCAICKGPDPTGKNLAVDHCHKTGKIRGLLCCNCNQGLGMFKDDWIRLVNAIPYIKEPKYTWKFDLK